MAVNTKNVFVGMPDQLTTGAVYTGPTTASAPTDATSALTGFTASGYVSDAGVKLTPDISTNDIKDWSGAVVRKILAGFNGEISFEFLEALSEDEAKVAFGSTHVNKTAATSSHGTQLKIGLGAHMPDIQSFAFRLKDGSAKMLVYVPLGQVTKNGDITMAASDAVKYPVTVSCYPDATGESIYILTDDGVVSA